jgi:hypothetical protein
MEGRWATPPDLACHSAGGHFACAPFNTGNGGPLLHDRIVVAFIFNTQRADEGVLSVVYGQHTKELS